MQIHNSVERFYLSLVCDLYRDIAECYNVAQSEQRVEINYISMRVHREGLSFLTKALPKLGKAVDTALSTGTRLSIQGFTLDGAVPKFLGWLLRQVFGSDGVELAVEANPWALKHFRQLVYLLYKLEIPHDPETANAVIESFVSTDGELPLYADACWNHQTIPKAREVITRIFGTFDGRDIKPRHGPGVVSTGEDTLEKTVFSRIYPSLERVYPFTEYMCFSLSHVVDTIDHIQSLEVMDEPTAKVVLVPKDSRGPRLISCEPLEIQWIQQGLGPLVESCITRHYLTGGFVNYTDQTVNGELALSGSKDGSWVTLDMKDASDRVSLDLVKSLFDNVPNLLEKLLATRSTSTRLPDGRIVRLNKFAPMGSRLCFPIESICFYALILSVLQLKYHVPLRKLRGRCFIFGDDIIMRREDYSDVLQTLPLFGLKFNQQKCCTHGHFRESCGVDAYRGVNVTPVRLRTVWCPSRKTPECYSSYIAFRNAMVGLCNLRTAKNVEDRLHSVYGPIPFTDKVMFALNGAAITCASGPAFYASTVPARVLNQRLTKRRFNSLHIVEYRGWISAPKKAKTKLDGWPELLRRYSTDYGACGGVYALSRRNRLKRGWIAV
jgi:hypothetical protein